MSSLENKIADHSSKKVTINEGPLLTSTPAATDGATVNSVDSVSEDPVDEEAKERRNILRQELARMKQREEEEILKKKAKRKEEEKKAREKKRREKIEKGITILPEAAASRRAVIRVVSEEHKLALADRRKVLNDEENRMKEGIERKLGTTAFPKGKELVNMAADFFSKERMPNEHLPENITRELTSEEIDDFRLVFDMFDVKNKGYITADDLKRAAEMLGYKARRRIFDEMIKDISKDRKGRVTFVNFLELVVKLQGDGPDPYEDIVKVFQLFDKGRKGYVTFSDVRVAADELKVPLSNNAIKEMMEEADRTGDGKITIDEFSWIMGQTGKFRSFFPMS